MILNRQSCLAIILGIMKNGALALALALVLAGAYCLIFQRLTWLDFGVALEWIGLVYIVIGTFSALGSWKMTRDFERGGSRDGSSPDLGQKILFASADLIKSYQFMIMMTLTGGLVALIGTWVHLAFR